MRTIKRILERVQTSGIPMDEVTAYLKSEAFKIKASRIDYWAYDFDVVCTSLEYLVAEYLP